MKKIGLIALVAMVALACKSKVAPVEEAVELTLVDSIVLVEGAGELVADVFNAEVAADDTTTPPTIAMSVKLTLHHQELANNGVYQVDVTTTNTVTATGTWSVSEDGVYELKDFSTGTPQYFSLNGDVLSMLDADKLPIAGAYTLNRVVAEEAAPAVAAEPVAAE